MANLRFSSVLGTLTVTDSRGTYTVNATSGRGSCMNNFACQDKKDIGPIPGGQYVIFRREINDPIWIGDFARNLRGDWGDWRVSLRSACGARSHGRNGFYLHGGSIPGSAGCIDIGGGVFGNATTDRVLKSIMETEESSLWVD